MKINTKIRLIINKKKKNTKSFLNASGHEKGNLNFLKKLFKTQQLLFFFFFMLGQ